MTEISSMVSLYKLFKTIVFAAPQKDAVLTQKWETDCVFWLILLCWFRCCFSLRLQDLQIKGRPKRREHLHKFWFCGVL